jgi:hypothetical protein
MPRARSLQEGVDFKGFAVLGNYFGLPKTGIRAVRINARLVQSGE